MLGAEGTRRLAYPEGCLDFPELAWSERQKWREMSPAHRLSRV